MRRVRLPSLLKATKRPRGMATTWLNGMHPAGIDSPTVFELFEWAASGTTYRRKELLIQLVHGLGMLIDRAVAASCGEGATPIGELVLANPADNENHVKFTALYWQAAGEAVTGHPLFSAWRPTSAGSVRPAA